MLAYQGLHHRQQPQGAVIDRFVVVENIVILVFVLVIVELQVKKPERQHTIVHFLAEDVLLMAAIIAMTVIARPY
jgi:hypothetical protein